MIATGIRERPRVELREALGENRPELRACEGPLAERSPCDREHRLEVQVSERRAELRMAGELTVKDGLHQRPEDERVRGRDEVDRPAHDDDPHHLARLEELGELLGPEALEPRPESRVRVMRFLRLKSDEVLNRVERRQGARSRRSCRASVARFSALGRRGVCAHAEIVVPGPPWCARVAKWVIVV